MLFVGLMVWKALGASKYFFDNYLLFLILTSSLVGHSLVLLHTDIDLFGARHVALSKDLFNHLEFARRCDKCGRL